MKRENKDTWLTLAQLAQLFNRDRTVIAKHIKNIWKEGELNKGATTAFFTLVKQEGLRKTKREMEHFNLDVIISGGYRVNSKIGTEFRQWATHIKIPFYKRIFY